MNDSSLSKLIAPIFDGDCTEAVCQAELLSSAGFTPQHIVIHGVEAAMSALDAKCTVEHFNLLEIMLAGRAVMEVMKFLYPTGTAKADSKATVVMASLEGDVHDLGKNILKIVLMGGGYRVVDCGKDCPLGSYSSRRNKNSPWRSGSAG